MYKRQDESKAEDKDKQEKAEKDKDVDPNINIHVLNAGNIDGLASGIGSWLEGKGYTVERSANAQPGIYSESQVVAADPTSKEAKALAKKLGGVPVAENTQLDDDTLIVVATDDYQGPSDKEASDQQPEEDKSSQPVGTPGNDFGTAKVSPEIDAGGDGPRCVN